MGLDGCSSQPEGVDDDAAGVLLNYVCAGVLLILGEWEHLTKLLSSH